MHPGKNDVHELYLMCDDVKELIDEMGAKGIATTPVHEERWGLLTQVSLPGGGKLGIYQPKHPSPLTRTPAAKKAAPRKAASKKKVAKKPAPRKLANAKKRAPSRR